MNPITNPVDLDIALHRALGSVFELSESMIPIFRSIFKSYTLKKIEAASDSELERILYRISQREKVQEMHDWIDFEIETGEDKIDTVVQGIIWQTLENAGIITKDQLTRIIPSYSQEIWAYSCLPGEEPKPIVRGQFTSDVSLDNVVFTPNNVFYGEGLEWTIRPGEKPILILGDDVILKKVSRITVFEDEINQKTAKQIVRKLIQYMVDNYHRTPHRSKDYQIFQNQIVSPLTTTFPSVLRENRSINYQKLAKIFRQVRRKNIDLKPYIKDSSFRGKLLQGIDEIVPAPHAVVKSRVKQREDAFGKMMEALYDLRTDGYVGGPKTFRDMYGIRIILPIEKEINDYVWQLKNTGAVEVVEDEDGKPLEIDHIKEPKPNGYQSYHITIKFSGTVYDIQLRTHEMDFRAETDPRQAHHTYKDKKRELIQSTPLNVRKVISTCLGLPVPSE